MKKTYPLADWLNETELHKLGVNRHIQNRCVKAVFTGEKRCPKRGEWYLSGAEIEAYRAPNDLPTAYHIAKLVRVETKTVITETILD